MGKGWWGGGKMRRREVVEENKRGLMLERKIGWRGN